MRDAFDQARQHFLDGLAHFQAQALTEAEFCFESALALMPGRPSTLTNLGATRVKLGKAGAALSVLEQATAAEPNNLQAWSYLALAHADLTQYSQALACYDGALTLDATLPIRLAHQFTGRRTRWALRNGGGIVHSPSWLHRSFCMCHAPSRQPQTQWLGGVPTG